MTAHRKPSPAARIVRELRAFDASLDLLDESVAAALEISRSDLRAIEIVSRHGSVTSGALARHLGLTTGSVTTLVDRMTMKGFFQRSSDPNDRRRVIIQITDEGIRREREFFGRLGAEMANRLSRFSPRDLEVIAEFLSAGRLLVDAARARIDRREV